MLIRRCVVVFVLSGLITLELGGQTAYRPLSGAESERLLNQFMPLATAGREGRYAITLRILPPFTPASQITIQYRYTSTGTLKLMQLDKPWSQTIDGYLAKRGKLPSTEELHNLFSLDLKQVELDPETARALLDGFWNSVREMSQSATKETLKNDGTTAVEIPLDPTLYEVHFQDSMISLRISVPGPEPNQGTQLKPESNDPLVRWMLKVRNQFSQKD